MARKTMPYILSITFIFIFISACSKEKSDENAARLRVKITGTTYSSVTQFNVDLQNIEVKVASSSTNTDAKWITLNYGGSIYNLFQFSNGASKRMVDQSFSPETITQIRLKFGDRNSIKTSSNTIALAIPDEYKDGIVFDINISLQPHVIGNIMLDFDVFQSVFEKNNTSYLIPHIRVYSETSGGKFQGNITPAGITSLVKISKNKDTVFLRPSGDAFLVSGLNPGIWEIRVIPDSLRLYKDTIFSDTIFEGKIRPLKIQLRNVKK